MKYRYSKLYWFFKDLEWMKVYFSPFKFFLPKLYVGKTRVGVPYFLPRKWVKTTHVKAVEFAIDEMKEVREHNLKNPAFKKTVKSFAEIYEAKLKGSHPVPLKIGFSFCGLGWKTKWSNTDFRHEWNPVWSFVCFGYQIVLTFRPDNDSHFWECYLAYSLATDKSKSPKERIKQAKKEFPCKWSSGSGDEKIITDYWTLILKDKYGKFKFKKSVGGNE